MIDEIKVGAVLIKEGTRLPGRLRLECETLSKGWKLIKNFDGYELGRKISDLDWVFVNLVGEITATALGFDKRGSVRRAAGGVFAKRQSANFSCLEVTQVTVERIFGLHHVMVAVRPRSIQEEVAQLPSRNIGEWQRAKLAGA